MAGHALLKPAALAAAVAMALGSAHAQDAFDTDRDERARAEQVDPDLTQPRQELIENADLTLAELFREDPGAAEVYEQSYGHAVFDTTKGGLILTGLGGTGVARPNDGTEVVFMRVGGAGLGLGAGLESYKLVLMFADEEAYASFVSGQWDGALAAQAAAGAQGVAAEEPFLGGVRAYRLTDGGLMAQVDVLGVRFWPYRRLNDAAQVEARVAAAARSGSPSPAESSIEEEREIMIARAEIDDEVEAALADAERRREEMDAEEARRAAEAQRLADTQGSAGAADSGAAVDQQTLTGTPHPERIDEIAGERDDLRVFAEAIKAAGLDDALTGDTAYTVFAPTDAAFESMSGMSTEELLAPENRETLIELLRAHIVADDLDRGMAERIEAARTIDGGTLEVEVAEDRFAVGDASVVAADLTSGNLRVHVVDGLVAGSDGRTQVAALDEEAAERDDSAERGAASSGAVTGDDSAPRDGAPRDTAPDIESATPAETTTQSEATLERGGEAAVTEPEIDVTVERPTDEPRPDPERIDVQAE